jgi:hypothetical protein
VLLRKRIRTSGEAADLDKEAWPANLKPYSESFAALKRLLDQKYNGKLGFGITIPKLTTVGKILAWDVKNGNEKGRISHLPFFFEWDLTCRRPGDNDPRVISDEYKLLLVNEQVEVDAEDFGTEFQTGGAFVRAFLLNERWMGMDIRRIIMLDAPGGVFEFGKSVYLSISFMNYLDQFPAESMLSGNIAMETTPNVQTFQWRIDQYDSQQGKTTNIYKDSVGGPFGMFQ